MKTQPSPSPEMIEEVLRTAILAKIQTRQELRQHLRTQFVDTPFGFPSLQEHWGVYWELVTSGVLSKDEGLERALRVKDIRTDSGVAPITVLTKPYPCPGKCVYCPTEVQMPKSYIASEPAAARALMLRFDPYDQVAQRVRTLERNGHEAKKIELIVKGGTWSSYTWEYRRWFITRCFEAANELPACRALEERPAEEEKSDDARLAAAEHINETAGYRIIGLTIETRPDWVTAEEIIRLRQLGCTRVELGVQTLQDDVLELTKRGHKIDATIRATALLKQAGFKVDFHILPGQPGSTPEKDLEDFRTLFADAKYRPDMIKLYPCVVLPSTELQGWAERGEFTPLEGETLKELLISMQQLVPRYCRISRLIRDFPDHEISFGNKVTNLREQLETEMKLRGVACQCLRCREVGHVTDIDPATITPELFEEWYDNAGGREVFLSMEDPERRAVFAFLRLRLPASPEQLQTDPTYAHDAKFLRYSKAIDEALPILRTAAQVRELHTYGRALNLKQVNPDAAQHKGYGRLLMERAEVITQEAGYPDLLVISGIGVREYYRWLGYEERETYMVKHLKKI